MTVLVSLCELNEKEALNSDLDLEDDVTEAPCELNEKGAPSLHLSVGESAAVEEVFELPPNENTGIRAAHFPV